MSNIDGAPRGPYTPVMTHFDGSTADLPPASMSTGQPNAEESAAIAAATEILRRAEQEAGEAAALLTGGPVLTVPQGFHPLPTVEDPPTRLLIPFARSCSVVLLDLLDVIGPPWADTPSLRHVFSAVTTSPAVVGDIGQRGAGGVARISEVPIGTPISVAVESRSLLHLAALIDDSGGGRKVPEIFFQPTKGSAGTFGQGSDGRASLYGFSIHLNPAPIFVSEIPSLIAVRREEWSRAQAAAETLVKQQQAAATAAATTAATSPTAAASASPITSSLATPSPSTLAPPAATAPQPAPASPAPSSVIPPKTVPQTPSAIETSTTDPSSSVPAS